MLVLVPLTFAGHVLCARISVSPCGHTAMNEIESTSPTTCDVMARKRNIHKEL